MQPTASKSDSSCKLVTVLDKCSGCIHSTKCHPGASDFPNERAVCTTVDDASLLYETHFCAQHREQHHDACECLPPQALAPTSMEFFEVFTPLAIIVGAIITIHFFWVRPTFLQLGLLSKGSLPNDMIHIRIQKMRAKSAPLDILQAKLGRPLRHERQASWEFVPCFGTMLGGQKDRLVVHQDYIHLHSRGGAPFLMHWFPHLSKKEDFYCLLKDIEFIETGEHAQIVCLHRIYLVCVCVYC